jgi:hypothetical protein
VSTDTTPVAQALAVIANGQFDARAKSPDVADEWLPHLERLCRGFGTPPDGVTCPQALFAQPLGPRHVAVVQVRTEAKTDLAFRFLILPRDVYNRRVPDPFVIGDLFPPDWTVRGEIPPLALPPRPQEPTTLEQLQKILEIGGSQTLLGAVQGLIDGGRLVFERPAPAPQLLRDLWQMLPYSTRAELWPATFAFGNSLRFDVLVVPSVAGLELDRYITEEQAVDYPEGRYEFGLQYAVEHGDRREVDRLLHRRSSKQMLRLALWILFGGALLYLAAHAIGRLF